MSYAFPPSGSSNTILGVDKLGRTIGELGLTDLLSKFNSLNNKAAFSASQGLMNAADHIPVAGANIAKMAGNPLALRALKIAGPLAAAGGVLGAGDVLFGGDSAGNKVMDGAAMTIGGILGLPGGPMGAAAGAGIGKSASDGLQWLFGDKKTAEQRKLEEALALLNLGVI